MSQTPFQARQCRGEGTLLWESRATVRGDRHGEGGREGWRQQPRPAGLGRDDTQQAAWPHFPPGLLGASPIAFPAASAPSQPPQGTLPAASPPEEGRSATNFSSSCYGNEPPELSRTWYPGESHGKGGRGMLSLLLHHLQSGLQRWRTCSLPG